jgi:hypothetical protein
MVVPALLPQLTVLYTFPIILLVSMIGCIAGSYMTEPDEEHVLINFYLKTRPWGFWKPIHEKAAETYPDLTANPDFKRDMFNVVVGIVWQTALTTIGVFLVIEEFGYMMLSLGVVIVTSAILKYNWLDRIQDFPETGLDAPSETTSS